MPDARRRDIVVPCEGGGHKVRLAGGLRFFARARCPKCRASVDPTRLRRLGAFLVNLRKAGSEHVADQVLWWLAAGTLFATTLTAVLFWRFADLWWPATLLLFGPRWTLLLPIPVLIVAAAIRDRALLVPLVAAAWMIVVPIMGWQTGWRGLIAQPDPARDLTVATFNAMDGLSLTAGVEELVAEWDADVAAFQECGGGLREEMRAMDEWSTWAAQGVCLLSRYPIIDTQVMPSEALQRAGGSGLVSSHLIDGERGAFWVTVVHLGTPRAGLDLIRRGRIFAGIEQLRRDSFLREIEHRQAAAFAEAPPGPHIVLGDFNAPPESQIYANEWNDWTNAFSRVGRGIGGTRLNGWIRARIDHVLVNDGWQVVDLRLGSYIGSDHLPVIATLRRR